MIGKKRKNEIESLKEEVWACRIVLRSFIRAWKEQQKDIEVLNTSLDALIEDRDYWKAEAERRKDGDRS